MSDLPISNLNREVYCLLGLAVDAVNMTEAVNLLGTAVVCGEPYMMSTPNVNFLINSQRNIEFRDAVLNSDLCVADGMPLIWIARMLGVPLPERVAGSDLFERLKINGTENQKPLSVFFFGGEEGVGGKAGNALNSQAGNVICVGAFDPGFVSLEEMSSDKIISEINDSGADFLVVALGAVKGHLWLERNKDKLRIPVRSNLGAVINFEAGSIVRSPGIINRMGFEWLWRIKEEPKLWRRYWGDGQALMVMIFTRVLPLALWDFAKRSQAKKQGSKFSISSEMEDNRVKASLSGFADCENLDEIRKCFKSIAERGEDTVLNFRGLTYLSSSALGTLMMLRQQLKRRNSRLEITGFSFEINRLFKWYGVEFLLADKSETH